MTFFSEFTTQSNTACNEQDHIIIIVIHVLDLEKPDF